MVFRTPCDQLGRKWLKVDLQDITRVAVVWALLTAHCHSGQPLWHLEVWLSGAISVDEFEVKSLAWAWQRFYMVFSGVSKLVFPMDSQTTIEGGDCSVERMEMRSGWAS